MSENHLTPGDPFHFIEASLKRGELVRVRGQLLGDVW